MSLSRREVLSSLAAAGALSTVPRALHAAAPQHPYPIVHAGCSAITWSDNAAQAIADIAAAGFTGIQLRAPTLDQYPDPHALRDLLARHKLTFTALSSGLTPLDPAKRKDTIDEHVRHAAYMQKAGGMYLQLISAWAKPGQTFTAADYKLQGQIFTEIGKRIADYGIKLGFHNHMNSIGQPPEAVDAILEASDPKYVYLELDTAHYLQGGGDPVEAIRKYHSRILFMHFKDVKNAPTKSGYEFVELGQGRLDFPAIIAALGRIRFNGWGIVELDRVPAGDPRTPQQANAFSLHYLRHTLGVRG